MSLFSRWIKNKNKKSDGELTPENRMEKAAQFYKTGVDCLHGADGKPNYKAAAKNLRLAADEGHPAAARKLGRLYQDGLGVSQDDAKAAEWYEKAVERGDVPAANLLGTLYDLGRGVAQDSLECVRLYHLAAKKGSMMAVNNLGYMYEHGRGLPQDAEKAKRLYRLAAEAGVQRAAQHMGEIHEFGCAGDGKDIDVAEALIWYEKAGCSDLYNALEKRILEGEDIRLLRDMGMKFTSGNEYPKDYEKAVKYLRASVQNGDMSVAPLLAALFETGKGLKQDHYEAYRLYKAAGRMKDADDVLTKALNECDADDLYYIGLKLCGAAAAQEDTTNGFRFLKAAAEKGSAGAAEMIRSNENYQVTDGTGIETESGTEEETEPASAQQAGLTNMQLEH